MDVIKAFFSYEILMKENDYLDGLIAFYEIKTGQVNLSNISIQGMRSNIERWPQPELQSLT